MYSTTMTLALAYTDTRTDTRKRKRRRPRPARLRKVLIGGPSNRIPFRDGIYHARTIKGSGQARFELGPFRPAIKGGCELFGCSGPVRAFSRAGRVILEPRRVDSLMGVDDMYRL